MTDPARIPSPFYRVSVKALIFNDEQRLLVVQNAEGSWELPGGGWEHGESLEECVRRELGEELGAEVRSVGTADTHQFIEPTRGPEPVLKLTVAVELANHTFTFGDGMQAAGYVNAAEFAALAMHWGDECLKAGADAFFHPTGGLRLRPFRTEDESAARAANALMATDAFPFLLDYSDGEPWSAFLERREANRSGERLPAGEWWAPWTFLAAVVDGELVGRASIRHELNDWLAAYGGHIGYGVVPSQRRKGYATEILRQSLIIVRGLGIDEVLVLCDINNVASARTIERCGGVFESIVTNPSGGASSRRYWIR